MSYAGWLKFAARWTYLGRMAEEMKLRRLDGVPRAEIKAEQLRRINALWRHAVALVPHYTHLRSRLSLPLEFESLQEFVSRVPRLSKREVQVDPRRFLARNAGPGRWVQTAGSTGRPLRSFRGRDSHRRIRLDAHYPRIRYGVEWSDPALLLWGGEGFLHSGQAGAWKLAFMKIRDRLKNRWRVNAYDLDTAGMEECRAILLRRHVRILYAYTKSAFQLARFCAGTPAFPDLGLVVISSEPEDPGEVEFMERVFGCPVVREYGAVEMGVIAVDLPGAPLRVAELSLFVETLPDHEGLYEILCTTLHNRDFPLIRYGMGDLTSAPLRIPPIGPASLRDVIGRSNDMISLPPDRWIHPVSLIHLIHRSPGILRLQVVLENERRVRIRLETDEPLSPKEKARMRLRIQGVMGRSRDVLIEENTPFETTSQGKHRFVIRR